VVYGACLENRLVKASWVRIPLSPPLNLTLMEIALLLIIANVAVFFVPYIIKFGATTPQSINNFVGLFAKNNLGIENGELYRLFTSTFLHVEFSHIALNMYSLWALSKSITQVWEGKWFLVIYFLSGIGGSLASYFGNPYNSIGASGSIFGLAGALISYAALSRNSSFLNELLIIIGLNLAIPFLIPGSNIDSWGHIGGLAAGLILGYFLYKFRIG
jgi:rhomboid protease GluP